MNRFEQTIDENKGIIDLNTPGFQDHDALHFEEYKHLSYKTLASHITQYFQNIKLNVLEIGSGAGSLAYWVRAFQPKWDVITLDGNVKTLESPYILNNYHFVIRTDRDYNITKEEKICEFDLFLCFEHLEHIERENLPKFFEMLNKHAKFGSVFFGSSSRLDYNRQVHVTLENKEWWVKTFENFGWEHKEMGFLNEHNKPFNFELSNTNELYFIKK